MTDQQIAGQIEQFISKRAAVIVRSSTLIFGPVVTAIDGRHPAADLLDPDGRDGDVQAGVCRRRALGGDRPRCSGLLGAGLTLASAEPGASPPGANLGIFVPMLEETSFVTQFLSSIDLFLVWWIDQPVDRSWRAVQAPHRSESPPSLLGIYLLFALVIGFFRSGS